ncbi:MAG: signal recognition particle receptor subunit alpha [Candidatus Hodarchaeota archaeon]
MKDSLGKSLRAIISKVRRASLVDEELVKELVVELQRSLIQADVNIELTLHMTEEVKKKVLSQQLPPGVSRRELTIKTIYDELTKLLGTKHAPLQIDPNQTNIFMFIGIQGSGKTTSLAKLALFLKKRGHKVGAICADTFRPGALAQLDQLLSPHEIDVYGDSQEKNAVKVALRGVKHFTSQKKSNVILIDTSGRHKEEKSLINEMRVLNAKIKPQEIILVIDGTIGQQAAVQAAAFNQATDFGSIILTKLDGSAKGGGAISAVSATGAKVRYIGMGEKIENFEPFDPTRFLESILGIPNLQNILDTIKDLMPTDMDLIEDMKKGIKLRHLKIQMEQMAQGGRFTQLIRNFMGAGQDLPPGFEMQSKDGAKKFLAICRAMTREELNSDNPKKFLASSRRKRIARGAGVKVEDVNALLKQYNQAQAYFKKLAKSRGRGKALQQLQQFGGPLG